MFQQTNNLLLCWYSTVSPREVRGDVGGRKRRSDGALQTRVRGGDKELPELHFPDGKRPGNFKFEV